MDLSKQLHIELARLGWTLVRRNKNLVYRCSCGLHQISVGVTLTDFHAAKNELSRARRLCP